MWVVRLCLIPFQHLHDWVLGTVLDESRCGTSVGKVKVTDLDSADDAVITAMSLELFLLFFRHYIWKQNQWPKPRFKYFEDYWMNLYDLFMSVLRTQRPSNTRTLLAQFIILVIPSRNPLMDWLPKVSFKARWESTNNVECQ